MERIRSVISILPLTYSALLAFGVPNGCYAAFASPYRHTSTIDAYSTGYGNVSPIPYPVTSTTSVCLKYNCPSSDTYSVPATYTTSTATTSTTTTTTTPSSPTPSCIDQTNVSGGGECGCSYTISCNTSLNGTVSGYKNNANDSVCRVACDDAPSCIGYNVDTGGRLPYCTLFSLIASVNAESGFIAGIRDEACRQLCIEEP